MPMRDLWVPIMRSLLSSDDCVNSAIEMVVVTIQDQ